MKHHLTLILLLFSSYLFGQDTITILEKNTDTARHKTDTTILKRGNSADTIIGEFLKFEPKQYFFQFDSSLESMDNFDRGYVDTFSISKNKFRIRAANGECCIVEKLKATTWSKNFYYIISQYGFGISRDVNGDGYFDFISKRNRLSDVYLFDTLAKQFIDTPFTIVPDWVELDKRHKIFCNYWTLYKISDMRSELYTFDKGEIKTLFYIKFITGKNAGIIKKIILYNNTSTRPKKIYELKVNPNEIDFDYEKFWASRYQQLMGYQ